MKNYTIPELSNPKTYLDDSELADVAKRAAQDNFEKLFAGLMSRGEAKEACLSGKYPEIVKELLEKQIQASVKKKKDQEIKTDA